MRSKGSMGNCPSEFGIMYDHGPIPVPDAALDRRYRPPLGPVEAESTIVFLEIDIADRRMGR